MTRLLAPDRVIRASMLAWTERDGHLEARPKGAACSTREISRDSRLRKRSRGTALGSLALHPSRSRRKLGLVIYHSRVMRSVRLPRIARRPEPGPGTRC